MATILLAVLLLTACGSGGTSPGGEKAAKQAAERSGATQATQAAAKADLKGAEDCAQCHEMLPEVRTWQLSSHSQLPCTTCHKVDARNYRSTGGNTLSKPIVIRAEIKNDVCESCHSRNRQTTASGDLIIPHDRHAKQGVACVKCHSGVVHANIAKRGITVQEEYKNLDGWTVETGQKVFTKYYTQPSMWTCIECHKAMKVTTKCSICHSEIPGLASHENSNWKSTHGVSARQDIGQCTKCHVIPGEPKFITPSTGDLAVDFARANQFCYKCHKTRPPSHTNTMLPDHPQLAGNRGTQNCFTCHSKEQPKPEMNVTGTYCNQCHWFASNPAPPPAQPAQPEEGKKAS